jgi:predicted DNA-binding transcriptional regulator AlpA
MSNAETPQTQKEASERALAIKLASEAQNSPDRLLTSKDVCEWLGRSHASLYRDIAGGQIPPPLKIGHSSRWPTSEIRALIEKAKAARDAEAHSAPRRSTSEAHEADRLERAAP